MIIDLAKVGSEEKTINLRFDSADIDLEGEIASLTGEATFHGSAKCIDSKMRVDGVINAEVSFDCTRCLEPIGRSIEIPFEAIFVDSCNEDTTLDREVADEELDESLVDGGLVDMKDVVREQILLSVPEQILCREDCKGLCLKCGSNLNLIDCSCADEEIDPRWAALKNLKKG